MELALALSPQPTTGLVACLPTHSFSTLQPMPMAATSPESIADRQVHSFLEELAVGTQRYEQVRNLEGQVEREYRGRVVFELLQNAHDALPPPDEPAVSRRVRVVLEPDALVVANDGNPVSDADLGGLCSMAISTKDPSESNREPRGSASAARSTSRMPPRSTRGALGTRREAPSTATRSALARRRLGPLRDAVEAFVAGDLPRSPFSDHPLVPAEDADRIRAKLRARESEARAAGGGWTAAAQTVHLSSYALPVALRDLPASRFCARRGGVCHSRPSPVSRRGRRGRGPHTDPRPRGADDAALSRPRRRTRNCRRGREGIG